jgi:ribosomal protection tetracycline resistance protein
VNKIDRVGAQYERLLGGISEKLTAGIIPMGSVSALGTGDADVALYNAADQGFRTRLAELLAEHDDALLAAYVDDEATIPHGLLRSELAAQTGRALVHPVFFGSAITGAGVDNLMTGIRELLPARDGDVDAPVSGTVFKVERGPVGEKIAYVRMFSGSVRTRDRLRFGRDNEGKVTAISVFDTGSAVRRAAVDAGQIGKLWGLGDVQIGDAIGVPRTTSQHYFAPPTLETVVVPCRRADKGRLHLALAQLAEQDPLINLRQDGIRQEVSVSLYGEVQKEVIQATLANDFGIDVTFRESTTICIERPIGTGADWEANTKGRTDENPFLATVGLRVDPAPVDTDVTFRLEVELGSMPYAFFKAVEETVTETLSQGLYGWQVTDCVVTMTHSGYWPRQSRPHAVFDKAISSTAGDFRNLTPLVLLSALKQARTRVYEPMHRYQIEIPADTLGPVMPVLARLRAVPEAPVMRASVCTLEGEIPAARVYELQQHLPALTRGEGVLESAFERYQPVTGTIPTRPRTDHNPLNRKEYLLHVVRRV